MNHFDVTATLSALVPGDQHVFWLGTITSFLAGLGTTLGAAGVYFLRQPSRRTLVVLISTAAGIMLGAAFFSLLQPAFEIAARRYTHDLFGAAAVIAGVFAGAGGLFYLHRHAPHEHFVQGREGPAADRVARLWLFVIAIALHNFPEGMAVGVGFGGGDIANGISLGLGIGLQNIPEGLAVAVSLLAIGYRKGVCFWVACLTGIIEPIGGAIGAAAIWLAEPLVPVILAIAAGAMLFIISGEIIPETHRGPQKSLATFSLLAGIVAMMAMDVALK